VSGEHALAAGGLCGGASGAHRVGPFSVNRTKNRGGAIGPAGLYNAITVAGIWE
jgi:hypothetical protein